MIASRKLHKPSPGVVSSTSVLTVITTGGVALATKAKNPRVSPPRQITNAASTRGLQKADNVNDFVFMSRFSFFRVLLEWATHPASAFGTSDGVAGGPSYIARNRSMSQPNLTSPLLFESIFMERMWGGRKLADVFGKKLPPNVRIGESWEIVDRPEAQSLVASGPLRGKTLHELWTQHQEKIFAEVPHTPRFPLLIKILDAQEKLSLQVHPPENVASSLGGEPKTEFWYVADADPEAEVFLGFREPVTRPQLEDALRDGTVADHVHKIRVHAGDAIFLPAGRFHAVGAGNLLIEIQQNSDTTYRLFDWNRVDPATGTKRDLHVDQAIQCIDFEDVQPKLIQAEAELLISNSLFEIRKWNLDEPREATPLGQFAIVCCLTGNLGCARANLAPGEFFLIPAHLKDRQLKPLAPDTSLVRVTIPV
jgi:mannose-6-phosphate isomerase